MILETTTSSSPVQNDLSASKQGDVIEATVVARDGALDLLDYRGQNLRARSRVDLPKGARVRLRVTKASTPLEVKLEAVIPDKSGPRQGQVERAIVRLQSSFSRLKGLMEGMSRQTQESVDSAAPAGKQISRPEGFLKAFGVSDNSAPADIKAMTFFLSRQGSGLLKILAENPEPGFMPDFLSPAAGKEGSGTKPAGTTSEKTPENPSLKASSGRMQEESASPALLKNIQTTGGKSRSVAQAPHSETKNPGRLNAEVMKDALKVNQDSKALPERRIPDSAFLGGRTSITKGTGTGQSAVSEVDAGRQASASRGDVQKETLTTVNRSAVSSGLGSGEPAPKPHSVPGALDNGGRGHEIKDPVPSEDTKQEGKAINSEGRPAESSRSGGGLFRRIFSSGIDQISQTAKGMPEGTAKADAGIADYNPEMGAEKGQEPVEVRRGGLEPGPRPEIVPGRGVDVSAGQDKKGMVTDLKTQRRIPGEGKLRQVSPEDQPATADKAAHFPSREPGNAIVREFASHVELAGQIQHHLLKETGQNLFIFPFLFSDMEGTGQWSFWKEDSQEQSPDSLAANSYHITFDLYLKNLGELNIHIFKNEERLSLFIAAKEKMLPVIRQGLSDITQRIKALGYQFETISCFSLEDRRAPEVSSLPFDPGKSGGRFHFVT